MTEFINKLDGLLLGDGCIGIYTNHNKYKSNSHYYFYSQGCIHKEWLEDIGNWLLNEGSFRYKIHNTNGSNWTKTQAYEIHSQSSHLFKNQKLRWYRKEYNYIEDYPKTRWHYDNEIKDWYVWIKIIPKDIELTQECIANWYMGDGSITKLNNVNSYRVNLATNCFTKKEVTYLTNLLNEQTTNEFYISKAGINKSGKQSYVIQLGKLYNVINFLGYIKPYIIPCFNYKMPEIN